jgi:hypothetical protein
VAGFGGVVGWASVDWASTDNGAVSREQVRSIFCMGAAGLYESRSMAVFYRSNALKLAIYNTLLR